MGRQKSNIYIYIRKSMWEHVRTARYAPGTVALTIGSVPRRTVF